MAGFQIDRVRYYGLICPTVLVIYRYMGYYAGLLMMFNIKMYGALRKTKTAVATSSGGVHNQAWLKEQKTGKAQKTNS